MTVAVPARLHLGFLDLDGGLGRRFGGIGVAISDLATRIVVETASTTQIIGSESERIERYLGVMRRDLGLGGAYRVEILAAVPAHAGLGSGTQLALAVAAGIRRLHGLPLDVAADAIRLDRGARSGVGVGLFHHGGLVLDGGRGPAMRPAPVTARLPIPDRWCILLVLDPARQGKHGTAESTAFEALPRFSGELAAHLCRLVVMQALPSVAEHDLAGFGSAITEMQQKLGDYYAPAQGGSRFMSPDVGAVMEVLAHAGATGVGQSSWGPTGFAFAPSRADAERMIALARRHPNARALDIRICVGLNRGAELVAHEAEDD
ncbi:MAG TPA: beta-ribofuranosylaminobenzene 5'-phosphate synthase family protein [Xanthobacteraceae bacterium]|nr:beta-ribofuranosylaminobenzene 5'-phosphate synthase family protein [Xanthobacteraceae bacterium]